VNAKQTSKKKRPRLKRDHFHRIVIALWLVVACDRA